MLYWFTILHLERDYRTIFDRNRAIVAVIEKAAEGYRLR